MAGESAVSVRVRFADDIDAAARGRLRRLLEDGGVPSAPGLDLGHRGPAIDDTVLLASVVFLAGAAWRSGTLAAETVATVAGRARDWLVGTLRARDAGRAQVSVELVDQDSGMTARVGPDDPDHAARILHQVIQQAAVDVPVRWSAGAWAPVGGEAAGTAVVLTALEVEYEAVREQFPGPLAREEVRGTLFELGAFIGRYGGWTVAIAQTGPGNPAAGIHLERAIGRFAPHVALFVGIAGGLKDVRLGDVVVADHVYDYETGKDTEHAFLPRIKTQAPAYRLVQRAMYVARQRRWQSRIRPSRPDSLPDAYVKPVAAGSKVVVHDRSRTGLLLAQSCGDALAVEMEGYGFLHGAYLNSGTDALVIRGISDLLLEKTESNDRTWQPIAARHAAAFALELLDDIDPQPQSEMASA